MQGFYLDLGGVEPPGEIGWRPSPSLEPVLAALRLAQTFSLGGGAGITFSGSLEEMVDGGSGETGDEGSPSLLQKTSFSPERSLSRHCEAGASRGICFNKVCGIFCFFNPESLSYTLPLPEVLP